MLQDLEREIGDRIMDSVVDQNHFGSRGAAQFEIDLGYGLLPLFRKHSSRPDLFARLRTAAMLLNLPGRTVAELAEDDEGEGEGAWNKVKLRGMTEDEARFVLSRRTDW